MPGDTEETEAPKDAAGGLLGTLSEEEKQILANLPDDEKPEASEEEAPVEEGEETPPTDSGTSIKRAEAPKAPEPIEGLDFDGLAAEFQEHEGKLTKESYDAAVGALNKLNFPEGSIDTFLLGLQAQEQSAMTAANEAAGGAENYQAMKAWAAENLSDAELAAYAEAEAAGPAALGLAVRGINAQFTEAVGQTKQHDFSGTGNAPSQGGGSEAISLTTRFDFQKLSASAEYTADTPAGHAYRTRVHKALAKAIKSPGYQG